LKLLDLTAVDRITLTVGVERREYLLYLPETGGLTPPARQKLPLVIFLHGTGGSAEWADGETEWSGLAGREGFALALPDALPPDPDRPAKFLTNPRRWNDGSNGPTGVPATADDVGFLAAVIADAVARADADPRRVNLSGFSNGAGMTFRAAAELADRFAAIAPVAGYCRVPGPKPVRPVPTLYMIGSADPLVPLRGGDVRSPWQHRLVRRRPVADTLERWAAALGCDLTPVAESDADGMRVEVYAGPVVFRSVVIDGLGHHWPGGKGQLNHTIAGPPSGRMDGTAAVWEFFRRHTLLPAG
jgi:polyhydroxybutyrate depolymerase